LKAGEKDTWERLLGVFERKWLKPKAARHAMDIVLEDISTNVLSHEDLGKLVKDEDGTPVMSHIAWAEAVHRFVSEILNGNADMLLKRDVHNTLPLQLRRLIPNEAALDTWEKWPTAVESISLDAIKDAVEESPVHQQLTGALSRTHLSPSRATLAYSSPRAVYTPPAAQLTQPIAWQPTASYATSVPLYPLRTPWKARTDDPFGGSTIHAPNTYVKNPLTIPISPSAGRGHSMNLSGDPACDADIARQIS
jgi:hypothetical protein